MTAKAYRARPGQGAGLEEAAGEQRAGLATQEAGPGCARPLRRGRDAVLAQDLPGGGGGGLDAEGGELAVDPAVSPRAVLARQAQDQRTDGTGGGRASTPLRRASRRVAALEQVAMPAHDRVRAHQQHEPAQPASRQAVAQASEKRPVSPGERGLADLTPQDQQLMPQRQDLDVLFPISHGQQAQEREGIPHGEVAQAQQHER